MRPIGGFFELETGQTFSGDYHPKACALTSGRACLSVILQHVKPTRVWLPFYSCQAVTEPLQLAHVEYQFYSIDANFDPILPVLNNHDIVLYINYFGLKTETANRLASQLSERLVVDNTQAFFETSFGGAWSFNSARKFFGVADGAYLYSPNEINGKWPENRDAQTSHLVSRLNGNLDVAFTEFKRAEAEFDAIPRGISGFSRRILAENVDYQLARERRRRNFDFYDSFLRDQNRLKPARGQEDVPFVYPFLPKISVDRSVFYDAKIYFPWLWQDCIERPGVDYQWERLLANQLLALPVDHRYSEVQIRRVIDCYIEAIKVR